MGNRDFQVHRSFDATGAIKSGGNSVMREPQARDNPDDLSAYLGVFRKPNRRMNCHVAQPKQ
jgi:hypothetical protein